jgi:hypothetical protein
MGPSWPPVTELVWLGPPHRRLGSRVLGQERVAVTATPRGAHGSADPSSPSIPLVYVYGKIKGEGGGVIFYPASIYAHFLQGYFG